MIPVEVFEGDSPVILGQPHAGTWLPEAVAARLNATGCGLSDTDWHIPRLYENLLPAATCVRATFHRYLIDANRDPAGTSLYPGRNTTGLCPISDFDSNPIWLTGEEPGPADIAERCEAYHRPYHAALEAQIRRIRARHGVAVLWDCHSIRSEIPFLFDGVLPVFSIGTDNGCTCDALIETVTARICRAATGYDTVLNGRFRGGWTTRHYGRPREGVHAIQMELAQRSYMRESPPWEYDSDKAGKLRPVLAEILGELDVLARSGALTP